VIYLLSKLVNAFFLPPGLIILFLLALALWIAQARRLLLASALLLWLLASSIGAKILMDPLERANYPKPSQDPVAVVVLGGGDIAGAPNLPLTPSGTKRLLWGLMEANRRGLALVYSGCEREWARASIQQIVQALNLPFRPCDHLAPGCYLIEGASKDTYENAKYTRTLFERLKAEPTIVLVTSAYHMPRSWRLFRHFGFTIHPSPTDYRIDEEPNPIALLPNMGSLQTSYLALHEYLGLASLTLRGIE